MIFSKIAVVLVGAIASVHGNAITIEKRKIQPNPSNGHWVDACASMPQLTEPANLPPAPFVRLVFHLLTPQY
jgi:disulfide bond formation protein DsbB